MNGKTLNCTDISILRCSSCAERTHCAQCGAEFAEALLQRGDVLRAAIDPMNKTAFIAFAPGADEDDILDALESMGVFV